MNTTIEREPAAFDYGQFRSCLAHFATGVTIVSAMHEGLPVGMTANSFTSVSMDPPLILWCVRKSAQSFGALRAAADFAVNVLASDQVPLAMQFARSGGPKFGGASWRVGEHGAPVLDEVAAVLECRQEAVHDAGDHAIIVGRVVNFKTFDRPLLVFVRGSYALTAAHPSVSAVELLSHPHGADGEEPFLRLTRTAWDFLSAAFEVQRASAGINFAQAQILARLSLEPRLSVEQLAKQCLLDPPAVRDAVTALLHLGNLVLADDDKPFLSAKGEELLANLIRRACHFEQAYLSGFTTEELNAARRVLVALRVPAPMPI